MSISAAPLVGFAFGEHLEGIPPRSLGYRLLAPLEPQPWAAEVEGLARHLQAAPYPDHWPPTELFCSVLLADGQRLLALARYGLMDHTASRRRSGLELLGVVGPGHLEVAMALAVYRWLCQRRSASEDLRRFAGPHALAEILSATPPLPAGNDAVPVLPIRLWEHGAMLFAATTPTDPDHHLGLLQTETGGAWQWLPLVGADFPLQSYAQRGPLVAWTPHLAGVAVKLDRKPTDALPVSARQVRRWQLVMAVALVVLLGANLWATLSLSQRLPSGTPADSGIEPVAKPALLPLSTANHSGDDLVRALWSLLESQQGRPGWSTNQLHGVYAQLVKNDPRLQTSSPEGQNLVATVALLSQRSPGRIESLIHEALQNKGYDAELIELACRRIHEQLAVENRERR